MTKQYEIKLCYFQQGDDHGFWSKPFPDEPAEALMKHSKMLESDAGTLGIVARYVRKGEIKVLDAQPESIFVEVDEKLGQRLVKQGILCECEEVADEEEEAGPHGHA